MDPTVADLEYTYDGFTFKIGDDRDAISATLVADTNVGSNLDQQITALIECLRMWRTLQTVVPQPGQTYEMANGGHYLCTESGDLVNLTPPHVGAVIRKADHPTWTKRGLKPVVLTVSLEPRYAVGGLYVPPGDRLPADDRNYWWRRINGGWEKYRQTNVTKVMDDEFEGYFGPGHMVPVERIEQ